MYKIDNIAYYIRQQVQNNNITLHYQTDGETVQHIAI